MCEEKKEDHIEKTQEVDIQKSTRIEEAQNKSESLNEGYQPTDKLDTDNPPEGDDGTSDSESEE